MRWNVVIADSALKALKRISEPHRGRMLAKIALLEENPFPRGKSTKRLTTKKEEIYSLRAGDYRALYRVQRDEKLVDVYHIEHRREVYRDV